MGTQLPPQNKGTATPIFGSCFLWPNGNMYQDTTWYGCRPQPRRLCVLWRPYIIYTHYMLSHLSTNALAALVFIVFWKCVCVWGWWEDRWGNDGGRREMGNMGDIKNTDPTTHAMKTTSCLADVINGRFMGNRWGKWRYLDVWARDTFNKN